MGFLDKLFGKKNEVSSGGSTIYRYEEQKGRELQIPESEGNYMEEIETYFDGLFPGRESFVYHEILSDIVHIDIHIMKPTTEQPFYVAFTTGMSDKPMNIPQEIPEKERRELELAELYMFLPGEWDLGGTGKTGGEIPPQQFWPLRCIKFLARFPHMYQTWLAWGHTIPNGAEYAPLDDSVGFGGLVLIGGDGPLGGMTAKDGRKINFYGMVPAYKEEIEYKLKYGMEELSRRFAEGKLPVVLNVHRPNLCADFKEILD